MVLRMARQSARQGRREDVEEEHRVHNDPRASRVRREESAAAANGLRWEKRWANLVLGWQETRLRRHDGPAAGYRRRCALTATKRVTYYHQYHRLARGKREPYQRRYPFLSSLELPPRRIYRYCIVDRSCHDRGDAARFNRRSVSIAELQLCRRSRCPCIFNIKSRGLYDYPLIIDGYRWTDKSLTGYAAISRTGRLVSIGDLKMNARYWGIRVNWFFITFQGKTLMIL